MILGYFVQNVTVQKTQLSSTQVNLKTVAERLKETQYGARKNNFKNTYKCVVLPVY